MEIDGKRATMLVHDPRTALPEPPPVRARTAGGAGSPGEVVAPIPGNVLQVLVEPGQQVEAGQVVCILEAMKMENEIAAAAGGAVEAVRVSRATRSRPDRYSSASASTDAGGPSCCCSCPAR